jgi:large subunit ribosomal protein L11
MPEKISVEAMVAGGQATAGPPLGPSLGPLGVNVGAVIIEINRLTKDFSGMRVPVFVIVDTETKQFEVKVGTPTTAALLAKEASAQKGSAGGWKQPVADLSLAKVVSVSKAKMAPSKRKDLKAHVLQTLGTCVSMGITVDGKSPKEVIGMIKSGTLSVPEE